MNRVVAIAGLLLAVLFSAARAEEAEDARAKYGKYFERPPTVLATSAIRGADFDTASPEALAATIGFVEEALGRCTSLRRELQSLFRRNGPNAMVHPDWFRKYDNCVAQAEHDADAVENVVNRREDAADGPRDALRSLRNALGSENRSRRRFMRGR